MFPALFECDFTSSYRVEDRICFAEGGLVLWSTNFCSGQQNNGLSAPSVCRVFIWAFLSSSRRTYLVFRNGRLSFR